MVSVGGPAIVIRPYAGDDWDNVWPVLEPVFRAGETYPYPRDISAAQAHEAWTTGGKAVFVAVDESTGAFLGTYYLRSNFEGAGSHICNCGYVVAEHARGRGVAARMCEHSQVEAIARGYRAMQYNLVVSTNESAVHLWKKMGFTIIGTIPEAFRHPRFGFVDAYVMYKPLRAAHSPARG